MASVYQRDKNGKLRLTKEEALEVRDVFGLDRNFWLCDMAANKELMQAALDVLHNFIAGNDYYMDYMDSQNGCRLIIFCAPCNISLSSYDPFMSHDKGKAHKKAIQLGINRKVAKQNSQHFIKLKPLNTPKNVFKPCTLEDMLDHCSERVLGVQFVYKERMQGGRSSYWCQLCGISQLRKNAMFAHLAEDTAHNESYLLAKFQKRIMTADAYQKICFDVETMEGKINHKFVDFTHQYEATKQSHAGPVYQRQHAPPRISLAGLSPPVLAPPLGIEERLLHAPPVVTEQGVQVDSDQLDTELPLKREVALLKMNEGDMVIAGEKLSVVLLLETMQTLNLKMRAYYQRAGSNLCVNTGRYQGYLDETRKIIE